MEILWKISEKDVKIVSDFYKKHMNNNFVKHRIEKNIKEACQKFSQDGFGKLWWLAYLQRNSVQVQKATLLNFSVLSRSH